MFPRLSARIVMTTPNARWNREPVVEKKISQCR